jgi:gas vesicle protein
MRKQEESMADGYDKFETEGGGGSFVMGLLTGTVLGAGLGMLFAPRAGSELRHQISEQAGNLANTASEGYRRASETAGTWAEKGRDATRTAYDKTREAVTRGVDEAERYVREATHAPMGGSMGSTSSGASSYGDGEPMVGAPEATLGSEGSGGRTGARRRS